MGYSTGDGALMRAGKLRHRLTIETATESQDDFGEMVKTFASAATVWGSVQPLAGNEVLAGDKISAEVTHIIRIRNNDNAAPEARITFGSRVFEITAVLNRDERNIAMQLACTEVV